MRWNVVSLIYVVALVFTSPQVSAQPNTISPPLVNPTNNHTYQLLKSADYITSAQWAKEMGGHLVWIENQAEQDWVFQTFANFQGQRLLWIGLTLSEQVKGKLQYLWSDGRSPSYTNWFPGEPNNAGGTEKYVAMFYPGFNSPGKWNDWGNVTKDPAGVPFSGVVEFDNSVVQKRNEEPAPQTAPPPTPNSNSRKVPFTSQGRNFGTRPSLSAPPTTPQLNAINGHWYQAISSRTARTWSEAKAAAAAMKHQGLPGHLVTITSAAEQQFVVDQIPKGFDSCWLGAFQNTDAREPDGDWQWVTGEPWSFTNWAPGEPNDSQNGENALQMLPQGSWNDFPLDETKALFMVEFEPAITVTTGPADKPQVDGEKTVINLPAPVEDIVAGRGGKLLILWLKNLQKLAIFDSNEKRIVKYLSIPSDDIKFAAGAEKLIVVLNDQNVMQRWNLRTFERELTVVAPEGGPVHSMAMGYASNGPLMIVNGPTALYDPSTMKKLDVDMKFARFYAWGSNDRDQLQLRASGDGSTFSAWRSGTSYSVIMTLRVNGQSTELKATTSMQSYLTPNFNGSRFYLDSLNADLNPVTPERFKEQYLVPVYGGGYFLALTDKSRGRNLDRYQNKLTPHVYSEADSKLLVTLPEMEEMNWIGYPRSGFTFDKRLHIMPDAQLMVSLPGSRDKLVLRRFNLIEELNKSNIDYLFVTSHPSLTVQRGQQYNYQVEAKSKGGSIQFSLESGAPGMTLSKKGKLQWVVPMDYPGKEESIIISISDASGQQIYHTFKIAVTSQSPQPQSPRLAPDQGPLL